MNKYANAGPKRISLEQFRATRREVSDIGAEIDADFGEVQPGWLYVFALYIERMEDGRALLRLGNFEQDADTPESLEQTLYEWGCREGYCDVATHEKAKRNREDELSFRLRELEDRMSRLHESERDAFATLAGEIQDVRDELGSL